MKRHSKLTLSEIALAKVVRIYTDDGRTLVGTWETFKDMYKKKGAINMMIDGVMIRMDYYQAFTRRMWEMNNKGQIEVEL